MALKHFYIPGKSFMHKLNPLVKLVWLLATFILVVYWQTLTPMLIIFMITLILAILSRIPMKMYIILFGLSAFMVTLSSVIWALYRSEGPVVLTVPLLNWEFTIGGVMFGLAAGLRLATMFLAGFLFLMTTPSTEWINALVKLKIPYSVVFAFSLGIRFFPTLLSEMMSIMQAQMARGFEIEKVPFYKRAWYSVPIIFPFLAGAIRMIRDITLALEVKGFGASTNRTYYKSIKLNAKDYTEIAIILFLMVLGLLHGR